MNFNQKKRRFYYINYWLGIGLLLFCTTTFAFKTPSILAPPSGSTIGPRADFMWTSNRERTFYWITIGSTPEASDVFDSGIVDVADHLLIGELPRDGRMLYVRLWYKTLEGAWDHTDATYTAVTLPVESAVELISPAPNTVLSSTTATFELYTAGEAMSNLTLLRLSRLPELNTLFSFNRNLGAVTSHTITNLPTDGRFIYALVEYELANGDKGGVTARFRAAGKPYLISPTVGTTLPKGAVDLRWVNNGIDIEEYSVSIGSKPEENDIFSRATLLGSTTSLRVHGIPENGKTVFIRLGYKKTGEEWGYVDSTYKASENAPSVNLSPFINCFFQCKDNHLSDRYLK